jgi:hypothetical protein
MAATRPRTARRWRCRIPTNRDSTRIAVLLTALLVLPFTFTQATEQVFDVRIKQREVVQPDKLVRVVEGDTVTLHWQTDESVALHLHGYDISLNVEPDGPVTMRFEATVSGRFPVTSHGFGGGEGQRHGHDALLYIEIYPQ